MDQLWLFEIALGVTALIGINFLFKGVVRRMRARALPAFTGWKEKVEHIFSLPFQILMWVLGVTLVMQIVGQRFCFSLLGDYVGALRSSGFVLCLGWMLWRWNGVVERELVLKGKVDRGFVQVMSKGIAVAILLLSVMIILQVWGLNVIPLIAFGGVGAAAIGFAAKDVLSNLLGGLLLYFNRPFILGDFIHLPEQEIEGYVEEVGWNLTTIRDKDKRPVYLPNSLFSSTLVINGSRMTHRRILETVGVRYEDFGKVAALIKELQDAFARHPDIDTHLPVLVVLNGFGDNGLNLLIDLYTLKTRYDQYLLSKHAILQLIYESLLQAGLEMPMPTFKIVSIH